MILQAKVDEIRTFLENGEVRKAEKAIATLLSGTLILNYWRKITISNSSVPNIFRWVRRIRFVSDISTARINLRSKEMEIGIDFYIDYVTEPHDLLFLIYHERNHILLRNLYPHDIDEIITNYGHKVSNVIQDIYINALTRQYIDSDFPERFYGKAPAPHLHYLFTCETSKVPDDFNELRDIHRRLYDYYMDGEGRPPSFKDVAKYFLKVHREEEDRKNEEYKRALKDAQSSAVGDEDRGWTVGDLIKALENLPVVSSHDDEEHNTSPKEAEAGTVKCDILDENSMSRGSMDVMKTPLPNPQNEIEMILEATDQSYMNDEDVKVDYSKVTDYLLTVVSQNATNDNTETFNSLMMPSHFSRNDMFKMNCGQVPTFWETKVGREEAVVQYPVFMDTSGSMISYYPIIEAIKQKFKDYMSDFYHFSDVCHQVHLDDNFFYSSYGTEFDQIVRVVNKKGYRRIIVITDNIGHITTPWKNQPEIILVQVGSGSEYWDHKNFTKLANKKFMVK